LGQGHALLDGPIGNLPALLSQPLEGGDRQGGIHQLMIPQEGQGMGNLVIV
jgi:hypothetical protein